VDAARQVVRWSIPGSVFVLFLAIFEFVMVVVRDHSLDAIAQLPEAQKTAVGLTAVLISTIPLGFLLYQLYYFRYMRGTLLVFPRVALRDRGADILGALPEEARGLIEERTGETPILCDWYTRKRIWPGRLSVLVLHKQYRNRNGRESFRASRQKNWNLLRTYLDIVCIKAESMEFKHEYTTVSDIYHAQGASRISVLLAWIVYVALQGFEGLAHLKDHLAASIVAFVIVSSIAALFWFVLTEARAGTHSTLDDTLRYTLVWLSKEIWKDGPDGSGDGWESREAAPVAPATIIDVAEVADGDASASQSGPAP
jgi:hypothetical protein